MASGQVADPLCGDGAEFGTPFFDFGFDGVPDLTGAGKLLSVAALESGRVWKTPVQARGSAWEDWAAFRAGLVANSHNVSEAFAGVDHVFHRFGFILGNVDADFLHGFNHDWIQPSGFKAGAVRLESITADLVQESLGHLAAGAVVDADKEDVLFHGWV
jgi:hypothetical protein